jgi:hypothetical protein
MGFPEPSDLDSSSLAQALPDLTWRVPLEQQSGVVTHRRLVQAASDFLGL